MQCYVVDIHVNRLQDKAENRETKAVRSFTRGLNLHVERLEHYGLLKNAWALV